MDEHVLRTYQRAEPTFTHGRGARLVDGQGREYIDLMGGIAVSALGHAHPALVAALTDQIGRVLHTCNLYRHPYTEQVAGLLAKHTGLEAAFFSNSGTEANECALKAARAHHHRLAQAAGTAPRTAFLALEGSFHGRTLGALSVTWTERYRAPFEPLIPGCHFVPAGDVDALQAALERLQPAALILEPIQGESGLRPLPDAYLRRARELCTATGTILIHDEVQSGCGRTGSFLAAQSAGVTPDIVTLAKPLGAGLPIGATVVAEHLACSLVPGDHGSTFGGGPLALRAALTFLELWDAGELAADVAARGAELTAGLDRLVARFDHVIERRGRGLMQGLRMATPAGELSALLHQRGVLTCTAGDNVLRLLPPYVIAPTDLSLGLETLEACLTETQTCLT
ncbi:aspartate aminotransferase family protein [Engelhardtia mirabilis]|uniref:Acetylornithine aminotransferase n=1 Tax=Engelhardtia mirabilis TaxID=2528011 RepID=A0A518BQ16_9BACT|nr:Acetylornithine aminotransferase [Planctomycetes bacterium Pla133]QDV03377.1 Acetylornithine aminotransferase [Planctomycetes bacterium Pla86]